MKTVGKQLLEARTAKGWTPEMAARETKIRLDRLRELEDDDYSNFSSPTYARGFVRTYARALGIDEYRILRQLDNKLPEDDNATFVNDTGIPYMPEPSQVSKPFEVTRGVYVAGGIGSPCCAFIGFILVEAYRADLFTSAPPRPSRCPSPRPMPTPAVPDTQTARAVPADSTHGPVPVPVDQAALAACNPLPRRAGDTTLLLARSRSISMRASATTAPDVAPPRPLPLAVTPAAPRRSCHTVVPVPTAAAAACHCPDHHDHATARDAG